MLSLCNLRLGDALFVLGLRCVHSILTLYFQQSNRLDHGAQTFLEVSSRLGSL
jgi:hypothetical protein